MFLKKLEIQGFKSFPEKIRLDFNKGITAVVGPNGSGKSNIADAVRWVLGEQSAKSLRGSKMEDIIFAGTDNRRALSFAEVTITLDNTDLRLSVDFSEVSVSRRVFRSGESEYLINGISCRLKDINELLMDTGIGKEGYSIIGQGRIEEILSTRSEDRRFMFEEAAGIVKYKNRKIEAEQKIAREQQNLERVNDIISEISLNIEPLSKQSDKAKRYLELKEKLKLLQVNLFITSVEKNEKELKRLIADTELLQHQINAEKGLQMRIENEKQRLGEEINNIEEGLKTERINLNEASLAIKQKEGGINLCDEQINNTQADIRRLKKSIEDKKTAYIQSSKLMTLENAKLNELNSKLEALYNGLSSQQKEFENINLKMKEREQRINDFNNKIINKFQMLSEIKIEQQSVKNACEQLKLHINQIDENKEQISNRVKLKKSNESALESSIESAKDKNSIIGGRQQSIVLEKEGLEAVFREQADELNRLQRNIDGLSSRLKLLLELAEDYEGYNKSVKTLIKEKKAGICGAVGELMEVSKDYELCIETALGSSVQNIVTETEEIAKKSIEYLKKVKSGRATFLPLTAIRGKKLSQNTVEDLKKENGIIGVAQALIVYNPKYENIFSNLLGRVIVANNIDNAIKFSKKYSYTYKVVTIEGELINPGGAITGGSRYQKVPSIFNRSREIKELRHQLEALTCKKEVFIQSINKVRLDIAKLDSLISEAQEEMQCNAIEISAKIQELNGIKAEVLELKQTQKDYANEYERLKGQLEQYHIKISETESKIISAEKEIEKLQSGLNEFQNAASGDREEKDGNIKFLMEIKSEISAMEQNKLSTEESIRRLDAEISLLDIQTKEAINETEEKNIFIEQKKILLIQIRVEIDMLIQKVNDIEKHIVELENQKSKKTLKLNSSNRVERESSELLSKLSNELTRLEMKKEQLDADTRKMYDEMWNEYNITYKSALECTRIENNVNTMQKEERRIKSEIQELGAVNVNAIEEFKAVKERFDFLSKQREDIIIAEEKLNNIITDLEQLMAKQFYEQFNLISENFSSVFREMFGGGAAHLQLSNEKNVLESGIEIIAQPPGKRLQSMSLLSGGERALTAIALLFGILRIKPSPFCILDEIDAMLDDSNVARYAEYLSKFSEGTQFILITHRKGSMEAANVLYGVTMQEQGISKLVSVKFTDNEE